MIRVLEAGILVLELSVLSILLECLLLTYTQQCAINIVEKWLEAYMEQRRTRTSLWGEGRGASRSFTEKVILADP